MRKLAFVTLCLFGALSLLAQNFTDSIRAFPGAEGYGAYVTGGRGGRVVYVLHTDDVANTSLSTYKNSLRAALEDKGTDPLTIVFMCGGVINLAGEIRCSRSNLTIAGQTALGDGICLKGYGVKFSGKNIIIRYIRSRPGDISNTQQSCLWFENGGPFIIDHCSFSWAIEETMTVYDNDYSTVQWCMVSESLYESYHAKGSRGYGPVWGGEKCSYHHNLLAHHNSRMPRIGATTENNKDMLVDYVNNVHYNWGGVGAFYGADVRPVGNYIHTNIINNYFRRGPAGPSNNGFVNPSAPGEGKDPGLWWLSGNKMANVDGTTFIAPAYDQGDQIVEPQYRSTEIWSIDAWAQVNTTSADTAYKHVLAQVGATLPHRDGIDERTVNEVETGTYNFKGGLAKKLGIIDSQVDLMPTGETTSTWNPWYSHYRTVTLRAAAKGKVNIDTFLVEQYIDRDLLIPKKKSSYVLKMRRVVDTDKDGMPDWWEKLNGLNPNDDSDKNMRAESGYTMLEVYLNGFPHENAPKDGTDDEQKEPTGIVDKKIQPHLRIYPNPVASYFNIETVLVPKQVDIYSLSGARISSFAAEGQYTFDTMLLREGIYFVKVTFTNGQMATQRIMKSDFHFIK